MKVTLLGILYLQVWREPNRKMGTGGNSNLTFPFEVVRAGWEERPRATRRTLVCWVDCGWRDGGEKSQSHPGWPALLRCSVGEAARSLGRGHIVSRVPSKACFLWIPCRLLPRPVHFSVTVNPDGEPGCLWDECSGPGPQGPTSSTSCPLPPEAGLQRFPSFQGNEGRALAPSPQSGRCIHPPFLRSYPAR